MDGRYDAVVVGGGHNGLVAAAYLARATGSSRPSSRPRWPSTGSSGPGPGPTSRAPPTSWPTTRSVRPLLDGVRGAPPADLDAVAAAMVRLSVLAADLGPALDALDVNPLVAGPAGCVAVDALVVPARPGAGAGR
jgi:hypothetical protein